MITNLNEFRKNKLNENSEPLIISDTVMKLSKDGIESILKDHDHVKLFGDETEEELREILQLNINNDLIDEIEVITILSGE